MTWIVMLGTWLGCFAIGFGFGVTFAERDEP